MDFRPDLQSARPYLVFNLRGFLYAVRALNVREIIWLPDLAAIEESSPHIAGVFNLRGKIIPVADLGLLFGHGQRRYQVSDSVIVIEVGNSLIGVIVNEVLDVKEIAPADIEMPLAGRGGAGSRHHYLEGEAKSGDDIIMVLDAESLAKRLESAEGTEEGLEGAASAHQFLPDANPEEKALFSERARNLRQPAEDAEIGEGRMPLAIAGVGGEYFGLDVGLVREFTDIRHVTPIPCCPPRIIGNMNLRGNIITLVDIRGLLDIPGGGADATKAVITEVGDTLIGIAVNEVFDVAYLRQSDLSAAPSASAGKYVRGVAPYCGGMMTVLDLKKIIEEGELTVNEEV
ncbi:MAG: purine-binding chemotaxis protein CheW [Nitrospinae bacterium]|nr:purine-binding chemotaxis protein CheW [Nitrospinota bacterium]